LARPEIFTADPNDHRELMVQVWYPAQPNQSAPRARYVRDAGALAPGLARLAQQNAERLFPGFSLRVPSFPFTHLKYITTNAIPSAPVVQEESSYPVLIFMEGLNGLRQMNTFQVEELVSHGYTVAAIDQPYAAAEVVFPDGGQVDGLSKDQLNASTVTSKVCRLRCSMDQQRNTPKCAFNDAPECLSSPTDSTRAPLGGCRTSSNSLHCMHRLQRMRRAWVSMVRPTRLSGSG
jgi:hypothetical protein